MPALRLPSLHIWWGQVLRKGLPCLNCGLPHRCQNSRASLPGMATISFWLWWIKIPKRFFITWSGLMEWPFQYRRYPTPATHLYITKPNSLSPIRACRLYAAKAFRKPHQDKPYGYHADRQGHLHNTWCGFILRNNSIVNSISSSPNGFLSMVSGHRRAGSENATCLQAKFIYR